MSSWMYDTSKQKGQKSMTGNGYCFYHLFFCSLTYTDLVVTTVADTASDEGEVTEKTCGSCVKNEKGEKDMKTISRNCQTITNTHFFAYFDI